MAIAFICPGCGNPLRVPAARAGAAAKCPACGGALTIPGAAGPPDPASGPEPCPDGAAVGTAAVAPRAAEVFFTPPPPAAPRSARPRRLGMVLGVAPVLLLAVGGTLSVWWLGRETPLDRYLPDQCAFVLS